MKLFKYLVTIVGYSFSLNGGYSSVVKRRANALTLRDHRKKPSTNSKTHFGYLPVNKIANNAKIVQRATPIKINIRAII